MQAIRLRLNPARIYLWIAGVYLTVVGAAGFIIDQTFPFGANDARHAGTSRIFGIFVTNGWHSLAGLVFGLLALYFLTRPAEDAPLGAVLVGLPNLATLLAFMAADPYTFWIASNTADQYIHAILGVGGVLAALLTLAIERRQGGRSEAASA